MISCAEGSIRSSAAARTNGFRVPPAYRIRADTFNLFGFAAGNATAPADHRSAQKFSDNVTLFVASSRLIGQKGVGRRGQPPAGGIP